MEPVSWALLDITDSFQVHLSAGLHSQCKPSRSPWANYWYGHEWFWCQWHFPRFTHQPEHSHSGLKKLSLPHITEQSYESATVVVVCEMDEQWAYVGSKKKQCWLFYAWESRFKKVLAHVFCSRSHHTLEKLLSRLKPLMRKICFICTDGWESYTTRLPSDKHVLGKLYTHQIERDNLNLRTQIKRLARKTICYSHAEEIHDKVIGEYPYREHYQLTWGKANMLRNIELACSEVELRFVVEYRGEFIKHPCLLNSKTQHQYWKPSQTKVIS